MPGPVTPSQSRYNSISDKRKMASYENERLFYKKVAPVLISDQVCAIAQPLHLSQSKEGLIFVLSDISEDYPRHSEDLDQRQLTVALDWLASFHAFCWQERNLCNSLSPKGSYWHLDTRPEEYERIPKKWSQLKTAARTIDLALKKASCTLVHGDFNPANIQFSKERSECVVYDFQYSGWGCPSKDICYLLFCFSQGPSTFSEEKLLEHYYQQLSGKLELASKECFSYAEFTRLYELAYLDFFRFLLGWYYHSHQPPYFMEQRARQLLDKYDHGKLLSGEL